MAGFTDDIALQALCVKQAKNKCLNKIKKQPKEQKGGYDSTSNSDFRAN